MNLISSYVCQEKNNILLYLLVLGRPLLSPSLKELHLWMCWFYNSESTLVVLLKIWNFKLINQIGVISISQRLWSRIQIRWYIYKPAVYKWDGGSKWVYISALPTSSTLDIHMWAFYSNRAYACKILLACMYTNHVASKTLRQAMRFAYIHDAYSTCIFYLNRTLGSFSD